ncbi:MAG: PQQ-binding-like beta-propeller repeat protein [Armatimonadetes bacterium]|nr:PQQ-binding-like beta-propeller repeat protein [Armatimonadota bacterium]
MSLVKSLKFLFFTGMLLAGASCVSAEDWTLPRGGVELTNSTDENLILPVSVAWQFNTSPYVGNTSQPVAVGNTVVFAVADRIFAVDTQTGAFRWAYPAQDPLGSQVKTSLAYDRGNVYFGLNDGTLYCISSEDGHLRWSYSTQSPIRSSPIIFDGAIYFGSDDNMVHCIDAETGEPKYAFRTRDDVTSPVAVSNNMIYFVSRDAHLYVANAGNGHIRYSYRFTNPTLNVVPVLDQDSVYLTSGNLLLALNSKSGSQRWALSFPTEFSAPPALHDKTLFVTLRNRRLYAISTSGKEVWPGSVDLIYSTRATPLVAGNSVVVASDKGLVSAFDTETGILKWRYVIAPNQSGEQKITGTNNNINVSPVYANGTLYTLADDGTLTAFRTQAPDQTPPVAYSLTPAPGTRVSGSPPLKMSAVVTDAATGVDEGSISLSLKGPGGATQTLEADYEPATGVVSYATPYDKTAKPMEAGTWELTLVAGDWKGNELRTNWSFIVDNSLPAPKVRVVAPRRPKPAQTNEPAADAANQTLDRRSRRDGGHDAGEFGGDTPPPPPPPPGPEGPGGGPQSFDGPGGPPQY